MMKAIITLSNFISRYMVVLALIVAAFTYFVPEIFKWATPNIPVFLSIIMVSMGLTLKLDDFRMIARYPKDVLIGILLQFTIMPLVAWGLAYVFNLPPELAVGLILLGTCPGGTSSNIMTYLAKGNVALSVSMTLCTTLLAPIVTPALTLMFAGQWIDIPAGAMVMSMLKIVVLPIILGIIINAFFSSKVEKLIHVLPLISIASMMCIMGGIIAVAGPKIASAGLLIFLLVAVHNLVGYAAGYFISLYLGMDFAKARAVSIEVGLQNAGLSTTLAVAYFTPLAAMPSVVAGIVHVISGSSLASYFAGRKEENAKLKMNLSPDLEA